MMLNKQKETNFMAQIFEVLMLICFGISWPISVVKSIKSKSAKGKSLVFTAVIIVGYICGIASKIAAGHLTYVLWLYVFNLVVVTLDMAVSIVNKRNDALKHNKEIGAARLAEEAKTQELEEQTEKPKSKIIEAVNLNKERKSDVAKCGKGNQNSTADAKTADGQNVAIAAKA